LAESARKKGDLSLCRDLLRKVSDARRIKLELADVTYALAKREAAAGHYPHARELFSEVTQSHANGVIRSLSQERSHLLNRIISLSQASAIDLKGYLVEARVKEIRAMSPGMFMPEVELVACPAAYRSGWDRQKGDPLSTLIRLMKRGVEEEAIERLGQYLAAFLHLETPILIDADFVIPVPTHPERETRRGYSIPRILAEQVSRSCAVPLHDEFVRTTEASLELRQLPSWYRKHAIKGAFETDKKADWLTERTVLIVDDVITTGSTVREVGRLLRKHGARSVYATAMAHTEWGG
jgi:ComF family protein